ncbi:unnamed protein product [Aureobasidium uvarum]|uniref:Uncharacterized protein n=1 Tax=Aureobasidium uvarum TaxID=2773716 RepID=A0A9N8KEV7_9PEZI|nr:unnamed protein product [Aureobasidium uvarum]
MVQSSPQPGALPRQASLPMQLERIRAASVSTTNKFLSYDPQPGMWAATGTAIARAPNLTDLRKNNIDFDVDGHLATRLASSKPGDCKRAATLPNVSPVTSPTAPSNADNKSLEPLVQSFSHSTTEPETPKTWKQTIVTGLVAFWRFFKTPTGFLITLYGLNVVAWGAMLFFLILKAAPAMNHPDGGDADSSPRKIWIEIDSQILNALFCLTAWGLAPWRFRDLWWLCVWRFGGRTERSSRAIRRLAARNVSWFRLHEGDLLDREKDGVDRALVRRKTFSGERAPATASWKMDFVVWMMVLNTLFQVGMAYMMWRYNRIHRPTWGSGLFIGLGCAVSMFGGLMCWWEGRKIKKIEGPKVVNDKGFAEV